MRALADDLSRIHLASGAHTEGSSGLCVMECVAYVAGEPHSDHPACACPVVSAVAIQANDTRLPALSKTLAQRLLRLAGSNKGEAVSRERAYFMTDLVFRTLMPKLLRQRAATSPDADLCLAQAGVLEAMPPIRLETDIRNALAAFFQAEPEGLLGRAQPPRRHLVDLLYKLRIEEFRSVAESFGELDNALSHPFDMIAVLDALLNVGKTEPVQLTPAIAQRLASLVEAAVPA